MHPAKRKAISVALLAIVALHQILLLTTAIHTLM